MSNQNTFKLPILQGVSLKEDNLELFETKSVIKELTPIIEANSDIEAVASWLNEYKNSTKTFNNYSREAKRLLLWCIYKKDKTLAQLKKEDLNDYIDFMQNPEPRDIWCGKKGLINKLGQDHPDWKPFTGEMSLSTLRLAIMILKSMFSYLNDSNYLKHNPLKLIKKFNIKATKTSSRLDVQTRMLENDEWQALLKTLKNLPTTTNKEIEQKRVTEFIVAITYLLGLRIGELEQAKWSDFREIDSKWWFYVIGKGNKEARIPVNSELIEHIKIFRRYLGLTTLPERGETDFILYLPHSDYHIKTRTIYSLLKRLGEKTALHFTDETKINKLKKLSPHWLRHLAASHQDKAGLSLKNIQENMRHSNITTTQIYMHAEDDFRHSELEKHRLHTAIKEDVIRYQTANFTIHLKGVGVSLGAKEYITKKLENKLLSNINFEAQEKEFGPIIYTFRLPVTINSEELISKMQELVSREAKLRCCEVEFE